MTSPTSTRRILDIAAIIAANIPVFVRRDEAQHAAEVRQLTASQVARLTGDNEVGLVDPAGAITGNIFAGVDPSGDHYTLAHDRWYDPTTIPADETPDTFFAAQENAPPARSEAPQWWTDPTDPASTETPVPESAVTAASPAGYDTPSPATPAPIVHVAELSPAASNDAGTHAVIPNQHAWFIRELAAAVEAGERDVHELIDAIKRTLGHLTAAA